MCIREEADLDRKKSAGQTILGNVTLATARPSKLQMASCLGDAESKQFRRDKARI